MIAAPVTKRIGIGLVAVCATLLTSACAAGQRAATANVVAAIDATNGTVGNLQLHDVAIKAPPDGPSYAAGAPAELQLVIVNTGTTADTLQSVSSPAASGYQVFATAAEATAATSPSAGAATSPSPTPTPSGSTSASSSASASASSSAAPSPPVSLQIPAGQPLALSVTGTQPVLLIKLAKALFPGTTVQVTFTFASAGTVTLTVPVQITEGATAGLTVSPASETGAA